MLIILEKVIRMKKIIKLKKDILYITSSWTQSEEISHGICGHTSEMIETYYHLKDHIKCKILWTEDITKEDVNIFIRSKYNFSDDDIAKIFDNSVFHNRPKLIAGDYLLVVDGGYNNLKTSNILFKKIIMFSCGQKDLNQLTDEKYLILQDLKVYENGSRTVHYVKKLLLDHYIKYDRTQFQKNTLLYLPNNCRRMEISQVRMLINKYNRLYDPLNRGWIIGTDVPEYYQILKDEFSNLEVLSLPIENFHLRFDNYIYTPTSRRWDCSNRLLVECKHYNKNFQFDINDEDYYKYDKALLSRKLAIVREDNLNISKESKEESIIKIIGDFLEV